MFPDEIISLIRSFARPLKRRKVGVYWKHQPIKTTEEMIQHVYSILVNAIHSSPWLEEESVRIETQWEDGIKLYVWVEDEDVEYAELIVSVTMHHILNWKKGDERYHLGIVPYWFCGSTCTQLINDNNVIVKSK